VTRRVHTSQGCLIWLCCRCSKFKLYLDFPSFMQWWQEVGRHQYAEVVFQWAWNLSTSKAFTLCGRHQYAEVVFQWAWNLSTSKAFTLCGWHQYAEVVFQWAWNLSTSKAFTYVWSYLLTSVFSHCLHNSASSCICLHMFYIAALMIGRML